MQKMTERLRSYTPWNEQEAADAAEMIRVLETGEELFTRENTRAHFTGSAWVVSPDRKMILMVYHNLYDSWSWLGGHADGEKDMLDVAVREVMEESGLKNVRPVTEDVYSVEILTVSGHVKRGKYVSSHLHFNLTYLLEADPEEPVRCKPDENSAVRWFPVEEVIEASSETWFKENIYSKLNEKLVNFR